MGVVYRATDISLGRAVAVKLMTPSLAAHASLRERFVREARAAAVLTSEHVAPVLEIDETPHGEPFIVLEHLDGMAFLRDGTLQLVERLESQQYPTAAVVPLHRPIPQPL